MKCKNVKFTFENITDEHLQTDMKEIIWTEKFIFKKMITIEINNKDKWGLPNY